MLLKDGSVRNAYTLRLRNMEARPRAMEVTLVSLPEGAVMWTDAVSLENAAQRQTVTVDANATKVLRAYVMLPPEAEGEDDGIPFTFRLIAQDESDAHATTFTMPEDD